MKTKLARQFPDTLYRIQIGTVRGKVVQRKVRRVGLPPCFVHFRMMIPGVVADDHDPLTFLSAPLLKELQNISDSGL